MASDVKKVVLAYSGGLDTSTILKWVQTTYGCEVVTFTADLGQGEELEAARKKAELLGIKEIFVEDLREEFVRDFVFPMFRANALYEGVYLLGTSIARTASAPSVLETSVEPPPVRARNTVTTGFVTSPSSSKATSPTRPRSTRRRCSAATTDRRVPSDRAIASSSSSAACAA